MTRARFLALALAALCVASASASPRIGSEDAEAVELLLKQAPRKNDGQPAPVVLWHGMGDSCCAAYSIGAVKELIERKLGVFVHSIATGDGAAKDIMSSYFGDVNDQVAKVCQQLRDMPELQGGYNAVGFSQGGQFLRAVAQRCQHTGPRMLTLVTLGAQHQGVMNIPGCRAANESATTCKLMQQLLSRGAYLPYVRDHVVQAQYFKDPLHLEDYLRSNPFLPDINNERPDKSEQYRANLASLERLVLYRFAEDDTVVPRDSAWFYFYNGTVLVPLRDQPLYTEDWIGLRELDASGRLLLEEAPGVHMEFTLQWFADEVIDRYLSGTADDYSSSGGGGGDAPTATLIASRRLLAAR